MLPPARQPSRFEGSRDGAAWVSTKWHPAVLGTLFCGWASPTSSPPQRHHPPGKGDGTVRYRYAGNIQRSRKKLTLLTTKYFRDHHHRKFMSEILLLLVHMHSSFHHFFLYFFVLFPQMARLWKSLISASHLGHSMSMQNPPSGISGSPQHRGQLPENGGSFAWTEFFSRHLCKIKEQIKFPGHAKTWVKLQEYKLSKGIPPNFKISRYFEHEIWQWT